MKNPLSLDLEFILNNTQGLWDEIKGQRIFITGGTGFIGCWLLESFAFANEKLNLGASTVVLTRNQGAFRKKAPHLAGNPAISFHEGDVRCFAFVGPYLPLDIHYAIGNFIRNGLAGEPLHITGDGTSYRSYLYAADLAVRLWTIPLRGKPGTAYNVGSEEAVAIADIAKIVTEAFSSELPVIIGKKADDQIIPERYLPFTEKARDELGLRQEIDLEDAIARTIRCTASD